MMASSVALLANLAAVGIYGYSVYFLNNPACLNGMRSLTPAPLRPYGQHKFLSYQCLLIQLLNALLHVGAHFWRPLRKPRDLVFTTLAYPVGSIVVYSFWAVWHSMGRDLIFPVALSQFYPDWLNHVSHTIIAPLNILMALLVHHRYSRAGMLLTLLYTGLYTCFLLYLKQSTGIFVYKYLESLNELELIAYFASTGVFAFLMYKSGEYLNSLAHQPASQRPVSKKPKQK